MQLNPVQLKRRLLQNKMDRKKKAKRIISSQALHEHRGISI